MNAVTLIVILWMGTHSEIHAMPMKDMKECKEAKAYAYTLPRDYMTTAYCDYGWEI